MQYIPRQTVSGAKMNKNCPTYEEVEALIHLAKREGVQQLTVGKFTVVLTEEKPPIATVAVGFALPVEQEPE